MPTVTWIHGLLRLMVLIGGGIVASEFIVKLWPQVNAHRPVLAEICIFVLVMSTSRSNAILAIRLYQRYAPKHVRMRCAMTPSCSEYAVLAIRRHGLFRGIYMTYCRLRHRCDGTSIIDYP